MYMSEAGVAGAALFIFALPFTIVLGGAEFA